MSDHAEKIRSSHPFASAARESGDVLEAWLELDAAIAGAADRDELAFITVNDAHRVVPFYQAVFWTLSGRGEVDVTAVSGASTLDRHSTAIRDVRKLVRAVARDNSDGKPVRVNVSRLKATHRERWAQYFPEYAWWQPVYDGDNHVVGGLLVTRDADFTDGETRVFAALARSAGQRWTRLSRRPRADRVSRRPLIIAAALLAALVLIRVPAASVGQAEIVPVEPTVVAAPVDGVVEKIHILPNAQVAKGDLLIELRDTELVNDVALAEKDLLVAVADHERARQRALTDQREVQEVELFRLKVEQERAELDFARERLDRASVRSPVDGVALYTDPRAWIGKPVGVGVRIMTIAEPTAAQVQIWVPANATMEFDVGATVRVYLDAEPGRTWDATLDSIGYEAEMSPRGVLAFRMLATLQDDAVTPRLGAVGSARVYSESVSLVWYLLRRPFFQVRQFVGW